MHKGITDILYGNFALELYVQVIYGLHCHCKSVRVNKFLDDEKSGGDINYVTQNVTNAKL